jgi:SpoIID/LytB domain protein
VLAGLTGLTGLAGLTPGTPAAAATGATLDLTGHGYGHGHGMGQWGALGYAIAQEPYQWIVGHYYGNSTLTTDPALASQQIRVVMTENDGNSVIVTSAAAFTTPGLPGGPYSAVMMLPDNGAWDLYSGSGCAGPWSPTPYATGISTPVASPGSADLQLCQGGGNLTLPGTITAAYSAGSPRTVNTLPLETYVEGVVPNESSSGWGTLGGAGPQGQAWGFQELEAQAVAARSYAMATLDSYAYADICDLDCQTYRGVANRTPVSDLAVTDTAGQVMEFPGGAIAATQYSASTGGYTDPGASPPGFPGVVDAGDSICIPGACNPNHTWTTSVPTSTIEGDWPQLGTFQRLDVTARNGLGDWGGRVTALTLVGSSGSVQLTGDQFASDVGLKSDWFTVTDQVSAPVVGMAATADAKGYWLAGSDGAIYPFGDATNDGSMGGQPLNQPIVGIAATADGRGYWEVAGDGGIFSFGDATFYGSTGNLVLNRPVVGMVSTVDGRGYWMVASDGGVFSYGDALFHGSMGGQPLNQPIVGMTATPDGGGYWLVAADGGIFAFGDASFYGSMGSARLNQPVVGMSRSPDGGGYRLVAADGGIFSFGDALFYGSTGSLVLDQPVVGMATTADGGGYWMAAADGGIFAFGDAPFYGSPVG